MNDGHDWRYDILITDRGVNVQKYKCANCGTIGSEESGHTGEKIYTFEKLSCREIIMKQILQ